MRQQVEATLQEDVVSLILESKAAHGLLEPMEYWGLPFLTYHEAAEGAIDAMFGCLMDIPGLPHFTSPEWLKEIEHPRWAKGSDHVPAPPMTAKQTRLWHERVLDNFARFNIDLNAIQAGIALEHAYASAAIEKAGASETAAGLEDLIPKAQVVDMLCQKLQGLTERAAYNRISRAQLPEAAPETYARATVEDFLKRQKPARARRSNAPDPYY